MSEQSPIFRKVSLDRLSSPEQLDQKLTVISPIGWIALVSLAVLIAAALVWGFLGSVTNKVQGAGMLMYEGGIASITSRTGGEITDVLVEAGMHVQEGQVIATVKQEDLLREIEKCNRNLAALESLSIDTLDADVEALTSEVYQEFVNLENQIRFARAQYEAQESEALKSEQDFEDRKELQEVQVQTLQRQVGLLQTQIREYREYADFQRQLQYDQAVNRPKSDGSVAQMEVTLAGMEGQRKLMEMAVDPLNPDPVLDAELSTLKKQISKQKQQIKDYKKLLEYQRDVEIQNTSLDNPNFDGNLASLQNQLQSYQAQLTQAKAQDEQLDNISTDFLWSGYKQTGVQVSALTSQYINLQQIKRQEVLDYMSELQDKHAEDSVITAGYTGIITGLAVRPGDFVQPGSVIGNIVQDTKAGAGEADKDVILYVPLDRGKLITQNMDVSVSPATVKREEHGYILGRVKSVSLYAITQEHMMATLQNRQLVQMLGGESAVLEVEVELLRDSKTVSGYKWSTSSGAPMVIDSGTICMGEIKVSGQRPIDLVVPFIKKLFSGS